MTKRRSYEPNLPKKRGPRKIYGDEPLISLTVRIPERQWAEILAQCPKEFRDKNSEVMRWLVKKALGN